MKDVSSNKKIPIILAGEAENTVISESDSRTTDSNAPTFTISLAVNPPCEEYTVRASNADENTNDKAKPRVASLKKIKNDLTEVPSAKSTAILVRNNDIKLIHDGSSLNFLSLSSSFVSLIKITEQIIAAMYRSADRLS